MKISNKEKIKANCEQIVGHLPYGKQWLPLYTVLPPSCSFFLTKSLLPTESNNWLSEGSGLSQGKMRGNLLRTCGKCTPCWQNWDGRRESSLSWILDVILLRCEAISYSSSSHNHKTNLRQNKLKQRQKKCS